MRRLICRRLIGRDRSVRPAPDTQAGKDKAGDRNDGARDGPERVVSHAGTAHHARPSSAKSSPSGVMTTPTTIQTGLFIAGLLTTADDPGWASRAAYRGSGHAKASCAASIFALMHGQLIHAAVTHCRRRPARVAGARSTSRDGPRTHKIGHGCRSRAIDIPR